MSAQHRSPTPRPIRAAPLGALLGTTLALTLAVSMVPIAGAASTSDTAADAARIPQSVARPISQAKAALDRATAQVQTHELDQATASLATVRLKVAKAHQAALAQIGLPPTDPESDDVPGPPSVLAVLALERRVTIAVAGMFDGVRRPAVIDAYRQTLLSTHLTRDRMLDRIIGLPPEGAGADYADGMADTIPGYTSEAAAVSQALAQAQLTPTGGAVLRQALERVQAAKVKVRRAFGGE